MITGSSVISYSLTNERWQRVLTFIIGRGIRCIVITRGNSSILPKQGPQIGGQMRYILRDFSKGVLCISVAPLIPNQSFNTTSATFVTISSSFLQFFLVLGQTVARFSCCGNVWNLQMFLKLNSRSTLGDYTALSLNRQWSNSICSPQGLTVSFRRELFFWL